VLLAMHNVFTDVVVKQCCIQSVDNLIKQFSLHMIHIPLKI